MYERFTQLSNILKYNLLKKHLNQCLSYSEFYR